MYASQQLMEKISDKAQPAMPVSAHLFDEAVHLTGLTEYGVSWEKLTTGQAILPLQGARFDIAFEGTFEGPRLRGVIAGVDYLTVRADGRFQLDLQANLTTDDGARISVYEDGILIPPAPEAQARIAQLRLNLTFTTTSPKYAWINQVQGWGRGTVDWSTGQVELQVYAA
jgi:hypothetical protein